MVRVAPDSCLCLQCWAAVRCVLWDAAEGCLTVVLCWAAGWGAYLSYGLPATIQLCTEWWMYEVVIFMAGELVCFFCQNLDPNPLQPQILNPTFMAGMLVWAFVQRPMRVFEC